MPTTETFTYDGYSVEIVHETDPHDSTLTINGIPLPLDYNPDFNGWTVHHTMFGFVHDLKRLAIHFIEFNPELLTGHH